MNQNTHLNLFHTYTKEEKEHQLENDLTRALAITLQENSLFFHEVLKKLLESNTRLYERIFGDFKGKETIEIGIQKRVSEIDSFDHIIAVAVTGNEIDMTDFLSQTYNRRYDPITDMFITIDNVVVIFEVKPNNINCIGQLYNQVFNVLKEDMSAKLVTAIDLNWSKIMSIATSVANFEIAIGKPSRFLSDFIHFIKKHNYTWLPKVSLSSLSIYENTKPIADRIDTAIIEAGLEPINGRLGFKANLGWTDEILFHIREDKEAVLVTVYPGNTKAQGHSLFVKDGEPNFKTNLEIHDIIIVTQKCYHIKLTSFRRYFKGLWFGEDKLAGTLYSKYNFNNYTGRKKRGDDWNAIANLFDEHFKSDYDWRKEIGWEYMVENQRKSQFDISFGYELAFYIPYKLFQTVDTDMDNIQPLSDLLLEIKAQINEILIE